MTRTTGGRTLPCLGVGLTREVASVVAFSGFRMKPLYYLERAAGGMVAFEEKAVNCLARGDGLFADCRSLHGCPNAAAKNPAYFERIQRELGLNLVIVGYSGELPGSVLAQSPICGTPSTMDSINAVLARHLDGALCSTHQNWHRVSGTTCRARWR